MDITWNTFPSVELRQEKIPFWGSNVMTSQKLSLTYEITLSVRIPAGPRPFFLKFKNFTATVRRNFTTKVILNLVQPDPT